ncbi:MAG: FAD-dependent oxidoreductase, partial [Gammaproteobacteria bacterium]
MANTDQKDFDIVIVGAGMVGATLARLLADLPVTIALLDRQSVAGQQQLPRDSDFDLRVSAFTPHSRNLLAQVGAWTEQSVFRYCDYIDMHVWDADGTGAIHFSATELNQPALGTIAENELLLHGLHHQLASQANVKLFAP